MCVFFKPLSNLLSSTGRRPPVKSVVLAKRVAEGVDGDDEHAQLDEVLQPQPQLGAAEQAAGAAALLGKPPGNYKHVFSNLINLILFANQKNWKKRTVPVSSVKDLVPKLPWWLECNPQRCFSNFYPIFVMFCECSKIFPGSLNSVFQTSPQYCSYFVSVSRSVQVHSFLFCFESVL